jgi:hypothetical protein
MVQIWWMTKDITLIGGRDVKWKVILKKRRFKTPSWQVHLIRFDTSCTKWKDWKVDTYNLVCIAGWVQEETVHKSVIGRETGALYTDWRWWGGRGRWEVSHLPSGRFAAAKDSGTFVTDPYKELYCESSPFKGWQGERQISHLNVWGEGWLLQVPPSWPKSSSLTRMFHLEKIGDPGFSWFHLDFFSQDGREKLRES